jgi:hypothetical protein
MAAPWSWLVWLAILGTLSRASRLDSGKALRPQVGRETPLEAVVFVQMDPTYNWKGIGADKWEMLNFELAQADTKLVCFVADPKHWSWVTIGVAEPAS